MTTTPDATPKTDAGSAPVLALPAPVRRRVLALTEAGVPLTRGFARLVHALRESGHEVVPLALPRTEPPAESVPTLTELKRGISSFAKDLVRGLRGNPDQVAEPWIVSQLRAVEGEVDAVLATDPEAARAAFGYVDRVFPKAIRVGCDTDYHLDPE